MRCVSHEEKHQEEQQTGPSRQCDNLTESSNDESSDEKENDVTICKTCKIPWIELKEKCGGGVQCDIYDKYIYPRRYDKRDMIPQMIILFCSICIGLQISRLDFHVRSWQRHAPSQCQKRYLCLDSGCYSVFDTD